MTAKKKATKKKGSKQVKKEEVVPQVEEHLQEEEELEEVVLPPPGLDFSKCPLSDELMSLLESLVFVQKPQVVVLLGSLDKWDIELLLRGRHTPRLLYVCCEEMDDLPVHDDCIVQAVHPYAAMTDVVLRDLGVDMVLINRANSFTRDMLTHLAARFQEDVALVFTDAMSRGAQDIIRAYRDRPLWGDVELPVPMGRDKKSGFGLTIIKAPLAGARLHSAQVRVFRGRVFQGSS